MIWKTWKKYWEVSAVKAVIAAAFFLMLWKLSDIIFIVFGGALLAIGLHAFSSLLSKHLKIKKQIAIPITIVLLIITIVVIAVFFLQPLASQSGKLLNRLPDSLIALEQQLENYTDIDVPDDVIAKLDSVTINIKSILDLSQAFGRAVSFVIGFFIAVVVGLYFYIYPDEYKDSLAQIFNGRQRADKITKEVYTDLKWWLFGILCSMTSIAVLTTAGLLILGVPFALLLGVSAGILAFIPNFGPILSVIPAFLVASVTSIELATYVIFLYVGVQLVESYLITPLIQKKAISLSPALHIIIQLTFGVLFGFLGLMFAVPFAVAVRAFYRGMNN